VQDKFLNPTDKILELIKELEFIEKGVIKLEETSEKYRVYEEVLQVQEYANFASIDDLRNDLNLRMLLWRSKEEWERISVEWMNLPFKDVDAKELGEKANLYAKNVYRCEKNLPDSGVISELKKVVYDFRDTMPVVTALRSPYLKQTHWDEIKVNILKQDFDTNDEEFTL
jgi:dynein heavy chain